MAGYFLVKFPSEIALINRLKMRHFDHPPKITLVIILCHDAS